MEYILDNPWVIWAIAAVVCVILELMSGGLVLLCFAVGALSASVASLFGGITMQLLVFILGTAVSLVVVKKFIARRNGGHDVPAGKASNADALIGRKGRVDADILPGDYGWVAIDGDVWKSRLEEGAGSPARKGETVEVISRDSIILTVRRVN